MGAIKDIHDLIDKLINSVKDRQFASEILKIQSLVSTVQSENIATQEKLGNCLSANIELKQKVSELEKENAALKDAHAKEIAKVKESHAKEIEDIRTKNKGDFHNKATYF